MPSAARVGDRTSHPTPMASAPLGPGPGSPNVLIGGMPAWRGGADSHLCPVVDPGPKPHTGGLVAKGSSKVLINGFPAARKGDQIVEMGISNSITSGYDKVQIGG